MSVLGESAIVCGRQRKGEQDKETEQVSVIHFFLRSVVAQMNLPKGT